MPSGMPSLSASRSQLVAPVPLVVPLLQVVHDVLAALLLKVPAEQLLQLTLPLTALNWPGGQAIASVAAGRGT